MSEHAPTISDALVRELPPDDEFRTLLDKQFGLGYYSSVVIGLDVAYFLAKEWNIVLIEPKALSEKEHG